MGIYKSPTKDETIHRLLEENQGLRRKVNIIKKVLKNPYKVINDYERGFIVTLFEQEVYVSGKFANQFENSEDSRSSILMEFAEQILGNDSDE